MAKKSKKASADETPQPEDKKIPQPAEDVALVKLIQRLNQKAQKENPEQKPEPAESPLEGKIYRVFNASPQTVYVDNVDGTQTLPPRGHLDIPEAKISEHIKIMVRRGSLRLFEKEKN